MSMSPEPSARADDRLVNVISRWLARHVSDKELRRELEAVGPEELEPEQARAAAELVAELERVARETLEALALG